MWGRPHSRRDLALGCGLSQRPRPSSCGTLPSPDHGGRGRGRRGRAHAHSQMAAWAQVSRLHREVTDRTRLRAHRKGQQGPRSDRSHGGRGRGRGLAVAGGTPRGRSDAHAGDGAPHGARGGCASRCCFRTKALTTPGGPTTVRAEPEASRVGLTSRDCTRGKRKFGATDRERTPTNLQHG